MSGLKIPLSVLERGAHEVDTSVSEEGLRPEGAKQLALGTTRVRGKMTTVPPRYVFFGVLTGKYFRQCDRCLTNTEVLFKYDVIWTFQQGVASEGVEPVSEHEIDETDGSESEIVFFLGADIDLALPAWEAVSYTHLTLPTKRIV